MAQTVKHAIIVCHPLKKSFTLAVADQYADTVRSHGHKAVVRDPYRGRFNSVLKAKERQGQPAGHVAREWGFLGKPDVFVLICPIWFGAPPAMLKGYIDRVFGAGRKRGWDGEGGSGELMQGKRLVSLTSSGSSRAWPADPAIASRTMPHPPAPRQITSLRAICGSNFTPQRSTQCLKEHRDEHDLA